MRNKSENPSDQGSFEISIPNDFKISQEIKDLMHTQPASELDSFYHQQDQEYDALLERIERFK